ncbi:MAG: hypothetical protein A2474_05315 [Elusimicrobia bacterium RIFOXYC2_FULL_34_12]|nr:MAG: hypothetical protein A2474_05315 [Elusimicrobia bacterium RIFOXYC2_FULL_34_12]HAM39459.1 two-component system response regulator [Elusimicrobiota bacterium]
MNEKILIIDDEENIVQLLILNLMAESFNIDTAYDGEEGLDKIDSFQPDLIILDIRLPKMTGWELCRKIKEDPKYKKISVIILTASAQRTDRDKAFSLGADEFLSKPFEVKYVIDKIKEILENKLK